MQSQRIIEKNVNPEVSVIVPLYNESSRIARALSSVLAQTFSNFEVIVVDDGSTDDGVEVVRRFDDPRIRLIQQRNQGVSAARNRGIGAARANLVAFLDSDDEWRPDFLSKVIDLSNKYPDAGAYATAVSLLNLKSAKRQQFRLLPSTHWEGIVSNYFRSLVNGNSIIYSSSVAIPKRILLEMDCFKIDVRWGEDQDLWGRIALKYPIVFTTSCCAIIHRSNDVEDKVRQRVTFTQEHPFIGSVNDAIKKGQVIDSELYLNKYLDKLRVTSAGYNLMVGNREKCKQILSKCSSGAFLLQKNYLLIWCMIPEQIYTNGGAKIFKISLGALRGMTLIKRRLNSALKII